MINLKSLLQEIRNHYTMPWMSNVHGLPHWSRVYTNARLLFHEEVKRGHSPDQEVLMLFAFLHDHLRFNDGTDPYHGSRAAKAAKVFNDQGLHFKINEEQLVILQHALAFHSDGYTESPVTIQICWDADRLDLGRVGKYPDPKFLCTETAKDADFIEKAYQRSIKAFTS